MSNYVHGMDVILEAYIIDGYKPFLCATDAIFELTTEIIPTTTADSGLFRTKTSRLTDGRITLSGVTVVDGTTGATVFNTTEEQVRQTGYDIRLTYTDKDGNEAFFTSHVLISSTIINGQATLYSDYQVILELDGAVGIDAGELATTANEVNKYTYIATGGETTISNAALIGRTILSVDRSHSEHEVITSGTPTDSQALYTSAAGQMDFSYAMYPGEYTLILYK